MNDFTHFNDPDKNSDPADPRYNPVNLFCTIHDALRQIERRVGVEHSPDSHSLDWLARRVMVLAPDDVDRPQGPMPYYMTTGQVCLRNSLANVQPTSASITKLHKDL